MNFTVNSRSTSWKCRLGKANLVWSGDTTADIILCSCQSYQLYQISGHYDPIPRNWCSDTFWPSPATHLSTFETLSGLPYISSHSYSFTITLLRFPSLDMGMNVWSSSKLRFRGVCFVISCVAKHIFYVLVLWCFNCCGCDFVVMIPAFWRVIKTKRKFHLQSLKSVRGLVVVRIIHVLVCYNLLIDRLDMHHIKSCIFSCGKGVCF